MIAQIFNRNQYFAECMWRQQKQNVTDGWTDGWIDNGKVIPMWRYASLHHKNMSLFNFYDSSCKDI